MKTIVIDRTPLQPLPSPLRLLLIVDSAISLPRRPLFLPDFSDTGWEAQVVPAFRISRLGKTVSERFASRYYDAFTLALVIRPAGADRSDAEGIFDSAFTPGEWMDAAELPAQFTVSFAGQEIAVDRADMMIERTIEAVTSLATIKTGDIICPCHLGDVTPIEAGTQFTATVDGRPLLDIKVR